MSISSKYLNFGIEIELLVRPKAVLGSRLQHHRFDHSITTDSTDENAKVANRLALREALAQFFTDRGLSAVTEPELYKTWMIVDEDSLDEHSGYCK
jgi:hypothetical protein